MLPVATRMARWSGLAMSLFVVLVPGPAAAVTRTAEGLRPESLLLLGVGLIVVAVLMAWARRGPRQDR